jgi:2'-5' RNA ligase/GNAT superfamily N-acetyltransferase
MARLRLGVALLLPDPVAPEVNGLRRAVGDTSLTRVPPHVTLVPPVNVREEQLGTALAVLRAAAAAAPHVITLTLGSPRSFLPTNPVLYLAVDGDMADLEALRDRVFKPPLERPLSWPFVAHVTLADEADPDRIQAATVALASYAAVARMDRVYLLREVRGERGRRWEPLADVAFGAPAVIGRGGLALELTASRLVDPEAAALIEGVRPGGPANGAGPANGPGPADGQLVITARREGHVVGVAAACLSADGGQVAVLVAPACRRQGIGSHLLAAIENGVRDGGWGCSQLRAIGPPGFYTARSTYSVPDG